MTQFQTLVKELPAYTKTFLLVSYTFSWVLWIVAIVVARANNVEFLVNENILQWSSNEIVLATSLLSSIATLGPLVGYLKVRSQLPKQAKLTKQSVIRTLQVFGLLALLSFWANWIGNSFLSVGVSEAVFLLGTVLYFLITSGTEEFGWRGVLYPHVVKYSKDLWTSSMYTAVFWAPWHLPIVLYIFMVQQNMDIVSSLFGLVGFFFSTVFMSYLHGWLWLRNKNFIPNVLLHCLHNAWPVFLYTLLTQDALGGFAILAGYLGTILFLEKFAPTKYQNKFSETVLVS